MNRERVEVLKKTDQKGCAATARKKHLEDEKRHSLGDFGLFSLITLIDLRFQPNGYILLVQFQILKFSQKPLSVIRSPAHVVHTIPLLFLPSGIFQMSDLIQA